MELYNAHGRKIEKTITQYSNESAWGSVSRQEHRRGITVYSTAQLQNVTGRDKHGQLLSWGTEQPLFYLTLQQRIEIFRLSSPILGVVTSRMNRLSGLNFNIVSEKTQEDRMALEMKDMRNIYTELVTSTELKHLTMKAMIYSELTSTLPDLLPDLSNFDKALLRWKRRIQNVDKAVCDEAFDWLQEPNNGVSWEDFVKKYVFDLMIHGAAAIYKSEEGGRVNNFDLLPGGSVYRIQSPYFSGINGYVQVVPGYEEPQIYFSDEIHYQEYIPNSARGYGFIPLEALINKIAESMFFDELMANQADGTKPPEKMVIVTDNNPFGSLDNMQDVPIDMGEQSRLEEKINDPVKGAIMTFSGNKAEVIDLSRGDTISSQMQRQKDIREEVALVFNMSNMEVNLSGGDDTSGRSTSEAQAEIEQGKGIAPLAKMFASLLNRGILPYRYGAGLVFEFEKAKNDMEEKQIDMLTIQTGENTKNDIREKYGKEGFGEEYDIPDGSQQGMDSGESEMNPMFTKQV